MGAVRFKIFLTLAVLSLVTPDVMAYEAGEGVYVNFHMRTRYDRNDGRDGNIDNVPTELIENRARLTLDLDVIDEFRGYFQLQDVRIWGEETSTVFDYSAGGLDVHQVWMDIRGFDQQLILRIGRQEISLDGQRLIGAVGWTPQGRSFDALRIMGRFDELSLDVFFSVLSDQDNLFAAAPVNQNQEDAVLGVLHAGYQLFDDRNLKQYLAFCTLVDHFAELDRNRFTLGLYNRGRFGWLLYRVEGYFQGGSQGDLDIAAFMLGARAGVKFKRPLGLTIQAWFDYMSGDDDPNDGTIGAFDVPYATNHKFYGMADFFINLPAHTDGKGLIDLSLKADIGFKHELKAGLHYHHFLAAQDRGGPVSFGDEIDFFLILGPAKPIRIMLHLFVMIPGDALESRIGGSDPDVGVYVTTQLDL